MERRYFMVSCMRGHVGSGKSTTISFAICARNMIAAVAIARKMPAVKHARGVLQGREISEVEYIDYRKISAYDR